MHKWSFRVSTSEFQVQSSEQGCQIPPPCRDDSTSPSPPYRHGPLAATPGLLKPAERPEPLVHCLENITRNLLLNVSSEKSESGRM